MQYSTSCSRPIVDCTHRSAWPWLACRAIDNVQDGVSHSAAVLTVESAAASGIFLYIALDIQSRFGLAAVQSNTAAKLPR